MRADSWPLRRVLFALCVGALGVLSVLAALAAAASTVDTSIDSAPPPSTSSTSATFAFSAKRTKSPATFTCKLDTGTAAACTSPKSYTGLATGSHTFSVFATSEGASDPTPATYTWTIDTAAPSVPTGLAATTPSTTSVKLTWSASTDNVGVTGYDVFRDSALLSTVGAVTTYTDSTVAAGSTHTYQVRARDAAGNVSALTAAVSVTTTVPPDTFIDSSPPVGTTSTSATFTFHASATPATFTCKLDNGTAASCTSPKSYTGLTQALHTFAVYATVGGAVDPTPAAWSWTVDTTAPSAPTGLVATTPSSTSVALSWTAATDNTGVTGYDLFRDGALLTTIAPATAYTDSTVTGGSTHTYAVRARDIAGNVSALSATVSATTPAAFDAHLTRAPYLTDLVGLHAIVNFATDQSNSVASVRYGPVDGTGACSLTGTQSATHLTVTVNATFEYQWKASLTLPAAGKYCYRVSLGALDLLGANSSPAFTTQVPLGSTAPFSFAVFGDWGQVDANGNNADQANLMSRVAASGARFAITTGDNGYPSGSQGNYGDLQQSGADTSAIFGRSFWGGVGQSLALFPVIGNHGLARADVNHPHLANWPQDVAVATSGGRYQKDTYCCPNGSMSAVYPSPWYAFDAGNARFYMLDAAWADLNAGTGTPYSTEYLAHWTTSSPEYMWLKADLLAHPSGLKFAFFHYPLYADQPSESSDTS
jgi:fibronectin type 3 domain-containing protein